MRGRPIPSRPVILRTTPSGVEHKKLQQELNTNLNVILRMTPSGVEHFFRHTGDEVRVE